MTLYEFLQNNEVSGVDDIPWNKLGDKELAEIKEDLKSMRQKWELSIHPAWMNERFERAMQKAENRIVAAQRQKMGT